ncbi:MAG: large conductance mechanosensitive channel protein MscL [Defluviitaleaceae bacterium]|nr:large conductance mechanosensitive channel protein MscL [Defluviitaleaceae bacterium]MCL2835920.1 large conductance mechanosensitive channel protein MscL [Defluviitaleaceae bacterium]
MLKDFKKFILRGNVIDLAVGIIIGGAFGQIVSSLVGDIFTPVLSLLTNRVKFENIFIALDGRRYDTIASAAEAGASTINIGAFITAVINFFLMACVVFVLIKTINALSSKIEKRPEPPPPSLKKCLHCYTDININATRCPACTSELNI